MLKNLGNWFCRIRKTDFLGQQDSERERFPERQACPDKILGRKTEKFCFVGLVKC